MHGTITRKRLLQLCAGTACFAMAGALGCGDSGDDSDDDMGNDAGDGGSDGGSITSCTPEVEPEGSHTHSFNIPNRDVEGGEEVVYEMMGSGHLHTLTVSKLDFDKLLAGESVMLETSTDASHSHGVTITCS